MFRCGKWKRRRHRIAPATTCHAKNRPHEHHRSIRVTVRWPWRRDPVVARSGRFRLLGLMYRPESRERSHPFPFRRCPHASGWPTSSCALGSNRWTYPHPVRLRRTRSLPGQQPSRSARQARRRTGRHVARNRYPRRIPHDLWGISEPRLCNQVTGRTRDGARSCGASWAQAAADVKP